jgi:hypothetical protein
MISEALDYVTRLQSRLWRDHSERGFIAAHEIKHVMNLVEHLDISVILHNSCMGFGIGISFYLDEARVLTITQRHLGKHILFDDAWPLFLQIAKRFEHRLIEPIREKSYYEY